MDYITDLTDLSSIRIHLRERFNRSWEQIYNAEAQAEASGQQIPWLMCHILRLMILETRA